MGVESNSVDVLVIPELDLVQQKRIVDADRRRRHEQWCQQQQSEQRFDLRSSEIRALLLVDEAKRLEGEHLCHQHDHCRRLIAKQESNASSPQRIRCERTSKHACACLRAPVYRQLLPKFRAMNLLLPRLGSGASVVDADIAVDTLLQSFTDEQDMLEHLLDKYGPESTCVDPHIWFLSIQSRQQSLARRWADIAAAVRAEFRYRDNFPSVIRNLSIMRIFLEGSQAPFYSCDAGERARRDSVHLAVLQQLSRSGKLFLE